jgi:hypothetical protein
MGLVKTPLALARAVVEVATTSTPAMAEETEQKAQ